MEFYAPAAAAQNCEFCQKRTFWLCYDDEESEWVPACYPGKGCGDGIGEFVNIGDLSSASGISLSLAMDRIRRGAREIEVIGSPTRVVSGDATPMASINGVRRPLAVWAKMYGIKYQTIRKRHLSGKTGDMLVDKARKKRA